MAQSHTWFATSEDMSLILDWLRDAQGQIVGMSQFPAELPCDGREVVIHFPSLGPLEFWPDQIRLSDYPENSDRWRRAILAKDRQRTVRQVDSDRSAAAGLRLPERRDGRFWVAGSLWFPGSRLRQTFPDLAKLCARFERWIRKFPTVYDSTKGPEKSPHAHQLCMSGVLQRVVALPAAAALLHEGQSMVDHLTSAGKYRDFMRGLELSGYDP